MAITSVPGDRGAVLHPAPDPQQSELDRVVFGHSCMLSAAIAASSSSASSYSPGVLLLVT
jgi:hypothetical protein